MIRTIHLAVVAVAALVVACGGESGIGVQPPPPPAQPPGQQFDQGNPPDWQNCFGGWRGIYTNLSIDHPHVLPRLNDKPAPTDPSELDWWDETAFERFDRTLDHGLNWWPVDDGLEGDPAYFAVYWQAWIRAWENTTLEFLLGSSDDAWVFIDGEPIAAKPGIQDFVRERFSAELRGGQYPIEVYFAHRGSETSGMSFRVVGGDVSICYPDFEEDAE